MTRPGHSLTEVVVVVFILGILALVAVPRLQWGAVGRADATAVAQKLAMDLRRARAAALLHAAQNPVGYAVVMTGSAGYSGYQIVDLQDSSVVDTHVIAAGVVCTGGRRFEFGPLGCLSDGSDTTLQVSAQGKTRVISIVSATGMVKCQ
jgi:prepilin-type N-terminal cleavage/methylation domain-containing protein